MSWVEFWGTVLPPLAAALAMVIAAAGWLAVVYLRWVAKKFIESMDREALHSAVSTGIQAELETDPLAPDKKVVASAARHVLDKGAPDAVKAFGLTGNDLSRYVASKVGEERAKKLSEQKPC